MSKYESPIEDFAPYFRARRSLHAQDIAAMQSIYELRYQVYCLECGFLSPADYPHGQESDEYDEESAHFCTRNLKDEVVGYVRLVPSDRKTGRFPWQRHCRTLIDGAALPPHDESAEVSRLMVRGDYRRRRGDTIVGLNQETDVPSASGERRVSSPQILLSMYRQMYIYSQRTGIRYWYAAMERSLARALTRMGFSFRQIGEEADYFGPVAPYLADLQELEISLAQSNPALLAWMQKPEASDS